MLKTDVLVIGGDPAGSIAAPLLVVGGDMAMLRAQVHRLRCAEPEQMTAN